MQLFIVCRRRRAAGSGGRASSRRSRSSHRSRSGGGRRQGEGGQGARSRPRRQEAGARGLSSEQEAARSQMEAWPHSQSFLFSALGCVLGMFSLNRVVILTLDFGGENSHRVKVCVTGFYTIG